MEQNATTAPPLPVAIIGAGPIGIELAVELTRLGVHFRQFEAGALGSTIAWYAPETPFFSSPERISLAGVPLQNQRQAKATREEYLTYLRSLVQQFHLPIETYRRVVSLRRADDWFELQVVRSFHGVGTPGAPATDAPAEFGEPETVRAAAVVCAIGNMHRPRLLNVPGENLPHVSHYFRDPHYCAGSSVVVVGGKNSAVEAALRLWRAGAKVTLVHRNAALDERRIKYWLMPELRSLIRDGAIRLVSQSEVREIRPNEVVIASTADGDGREPQPFPADFVFLLTGYDQDPALLRQIGVALEGECQAPVLDPDRYEASVPGLYVVGTAVAGSERTGVTQFIETSHLHVERVVAALTGKRPASHALEQRQGAEVET